MKLAFLGFFKSDPEQVFVKFLKLHFLLIVNPILVPDPWIIQE